MPVGQVNNSQMKDILDSEFQRSSDPSFLARIAVSKYLNLPGLRGFWGPGIRNDTAYAGVPAITDQSGNGYHMPTVDAPVLYTLPYYPSYWNFDGAADYCTLADNTHFDILGSEAFIANKGISFGAWVNTGRARPYAGNESIISKWSFAANNWSYLLEFETANNNGLTLVLSETGANQYFYDHSKAIVENTWYFVAATFNVAAYSGEAAGARLWVNDIMQYHNTTDRGVAGLPAAIFNGNQALQFASLGGASNLFQGYQTYWWICGNYISEGQVFNLYETTKTLFGYANQKGSSW